MAVIRKVVEAEGSDISELREESERLVARPHGPAVACRQGVGWLAEDLLQGSYPPLGHHVQAEL